MDSNMRRKESIDLSRMNSGIRQFTQLSDPSAEQECHVILRIDHVTFT